MRITIDPPYDTLAGEKAKASGVSIHAWVNAAVSAAVNGSDVFVAYQDDEIMDGGTP